MNPTDEELLHAFYIGDTAALEQLAERHGALLGRVAYLILRARTGSAVQALAEWEIAERFSKLVGPRADDTRSSVWDMAPPAAVRTNVAHLPLVPGDGSTSGFSAAVLIGRRRHRCLRGGLSQVAVPLIDWEYHP